MKILLVGSLGTVGSAVDAALRARGHELVVANLEAGPLRIDITDTRSITRAYETSGEVDAVVCTVGVVPLKPLSQTTKADIDEAVADKLSSQIDLVLQGQRYVRPKG